MISKNEIHYFKKPQRRIFIKVAIYGGSFDPPHRGHLAIMKEALKTLEIDKLLVIPTFLNPFKTDVAAPAKLRLAWMQKLSSFSSKIEVLDIETSLSQASTTYETLEKLKLRYNFTQKPYLIIGADNLEGLHRWSQYEKLSLAVSFVVASRDTYKNEHDFLKLDVHYDVSSTDLRLNPDKKYLPEILADEIISFYKKQGKQ